MSKIEIIATLIILAQIVMLLFVSRGWTIKSTFKNTVIDWFEGFMIIWVLLIFGLIIIN